MTAGEDLAPERFPRRADKEAAKTKPIVELTAADLAPIPRVFGAAGSPTWVEGLETVVVERAGRIVEGDLDAAIATVVGELAARGLFAPVGRRARRRLRRCAATARPTSESAAAIWVVAEIFGGAVRRVTLELLAKARRLADERGARSPPCCSGTTCAGTPSSWRVTARIASCWPTTRGSRPTRPSPTPRC